MVLLQRHLTFARWSVPTAPYATTHLCAAGSLARRAVGKTAHRATWFDSQKQV